VAKRKKSAVLPIALSAMILAIIAVVMVVFEKPRINPETSCLMSGPKSITAVIIDTSDPLMPHQEEAFQGFIKELTGLKPSKYYVPKHHLLVAYEIAKTQEGKPKKIFRSCNPGDPEKRDATAKLTEGTILSRIRWAQFKKKLSDAFPDSMTKHEAPLSPIIETIRYVRNAEFPSSAVLKGTGNSEGVIFIISDLLQNTDRLTHFGKLPPYKNVPSNFALELSGIDIGLRYLKFGKYQEYQTKSHFAWWRKFFAISGARMRTPGVW